MLPLMEGDGHADGDGLRDAVAARGKADALEAVDDEHSEDGDRKSTRLNSSHNNQSRMPSSA